MVLSAMSEPVAGPTAGFRHLLLHVSDTHLVGGGRPLYGAVDSRARLAQLLEEFSDSGNRPELAIITGDLADRGEADAYRDLRAMMKPLEKRGARVVYLMGNHDDRSTFRREILDDARATTPLYGVRYLGGLRIIFLDTSVPGFHHGELDQTQLNWLSNELHNAAAEGTILAMHHPPIQNVQPLANLSGLRQVDALAEVIRGSDVRLILAGHLHTSSAGMFVGIPVSVASSTSYTQDPNVAEGGSRGRDGAQSLTLVHVFEEAIVTTVSPIGRYSTVGEYLDPQAVSDRLRIGVDPVTGLA
jgi:Icc protein